MKTNVPTETPLPQNPEALLIYTFVKLDKTALGIAFGTLLGLGIFIATLFLAIKGGDRLGQMLGLLSQFFRGYSVTTGGSFVGLVYGFIVGFILGWLTAFLRNFFLTLYLSIVKLRIAMSSMEDYVDGP
jgi:hypothetical protein